MTRPLVVAITGGSGAVYAVRLLQVLLAGGREVFLMLSRSGADVIRQELQLELNLSVAGFDAEPLVTYRSPWSESVPELPDDWRERLTYAAIDDYFSPIASGSFLTDGMVVCPCSGSTLSSIARAASSNLVHRAAEVHLKERRSLVLVTRETPLSVIALENMTLAAKAGATLLPAMPGWYHGVRGLDDLVDFVVARILDQLGIENHLMQRWGEA
ncbi:UbiX family flavin prenyltransferase [Rosistilla oblonga]|uniref:Flavin prenyltransferase UbiX n=1 Tax=Rosistilla oblonga TaxID=2527990 RepID=A0A518IX86_9BACT|nr:flavin prenyltransferase UbiX [Rosistilla oblonga]QDV57696.1 putative aromatic acid decarboxylase [Rosistilla oblonga]